MTSPALKLAGRIVVAILLVMLAAGSVFAVAATLPATPGPSGTTPQVTDETPDAATAADATPSPANLARIVELLAAVEITTTPEDLAALAAEVGVGGAVRVLRFADASGKTPAEILAFFQSGKGWGVIVRELELDINPGNGSVMGKGHGGDAAAKAADRAARAAAKAARAAERAARGAGASD
jgi:hypothetical protein